MAIWMSQQFKNGTTAIFLDGKHMEVIFIDANGRTHEYQCEGTSARVEELLNASEEDEFNPDDIQGWESGSSFETTIKPLSGADEQ